MILNEQKWIATVGVLSAFALGPDTAFGQAAQFVSCPAPIAHCVHSVSGWCEKEPNGKIMIVFYDRSMSGERYRQCLNDALAKRGQQKPAPKR
jgi:hypothetical protein